MNYEQLEQLMASMGQSILEKMAIEMQKQHDKFLEELTAAETSLQSQITAIEEDVDVEEDANAPTNTKEAVAY